MNCTRAEIQFCTAVALVKVLLPAPTYIHALRRRLRCVSMRKNFDQRRKKNRERENARMVSNQTARKEEKSHLAESFGVSVLWNFLLGFLRLFGVVVICYTLDVTLWLLFDINTLEMIEKKENLFDGKYCYFGDCVKIQSKKIDRFVFSFFWENYIFMAACISYTWSCIFRIDIGLKFHSGIAKSIYKFLRAIQMYIRIHK